MAWQYAEQRMHVEGCLTSVCGRRWQWARDEDKLQTCMRERQSIKVCVCRSGGREDSILSAILLPCCHAAMTISAYRMHLLHKIQTQPNLPTSPLSRTHSLTHSLARSLTLVLESKP